MIAGLALRAFLKAHWVPIMIGIAVLGALWFVDHRGYQRSENEHKAAEAARLQQSIAIVGAIGRNLNHRFALLDAQLGAELGEIDRQERNLAQPRIRQELARDPGLATRQCLTPGLLDAINLSRGLGVGEPPKPAGADARSMP